MKEKVIMYSGGHSGAGKSYLMSALTSKVKSCSNCKHRQPVSKKATVEPKTFTVHDKDGNEEVREFNMSPYKNFKCEENIEVTDLDGNVTNTHTLKFGIIDCPDYEKDE